MDKSYWDVIHDSWNDGADIQNTLKHMEVALTNWKNDTFLGIINKKKSIG